ncbi:hypothetical protein LPJ53_006383 [Coemansia erecta]|uniref:Uncharacterized protein n=1 Tax=Coemansia erecta TaxID=147472 RepID=A0A9W8CM29_9FUNG|nr:hypothetical protein LPJ53_006383 [Coemansia erecta]
MCWDSVSGTLSHKRASVETIAAKKNATAPQLFAKPGSPVANDFMSNTSYIPSLADFASTKASADARRRLFTECHSLPISTGIPRPTKLAGSNASVKAGHILRANIRDLPRFTEVKQNIDNAVVAPIEKEVAVSDAASADLFAVKLENASLTDLLATEQNTVSMLYDRIEKMAADFKAVSVKLSKAREEKQAAVDRASELASKLSATEALLAAQCSSGSDDELTTAAGLPSPALSVNEVNEDSAHDGRFFAGLSKRGKELPIAGKCVAADVPSSPTLSVKKSGVSPCDGASSPNEYHAEQCTRFSMLCNGCTCCDMLNDAARVYQSNDNLYRLENRRLRKQRDKYVVKCNRLQESYYQECLKSPEEMETLAWATREAQKYVAMSEANQDTEIESF